MATLQEALNWANGGWRNSQYKRGNGIDVDGAYGLQCMDFTMGYTLFLAGWRPSGNAIALTTQPIPAGWQRIRNSASFVPQPGDIAIWGLGSFAKYGHTGIILSGNMNTFVSVDQNWNNPSLTVGSPPAVINHNYNGFWGVIRPPFSAVPTNPTAPGQRKVGSIRVAQRKQPKINGEFVQWLDPNVIGTFKGFIKGDSVEGNDIWFVGALSGYTSWSGGFTDSSTNGLPDLTPAPTPAPAPVLQPYQRKVGSSNVNYRKIPYLGDNILQVLDANATADFDAWVEGEEVNGSKIWFRGKYTGGFSHNLGFVDSSTNGLPKAEAPQPGMPTLPPTTVPAPTNDPLVTKVYNKKHPLDNGYEPTDLVDVGAGQKLRNEAAASLQLMSARAKFDKVNIIPQSGYRSFAKQKQLYDDYVAKDGKAEADTYSARPGYSEHQSGLAMDFSPIDASFENGLAFKWLKESAYTYGWVLRYPKDKEVITGYIYEPWHWRYVGINAVLEMRAKSLTTLEELFNIEGGTYPPDPVEPTPPPEPVPPSDDNAIDKENNALLKKLVELVQWIVDKLKSGFK